MLERKYQGALIRRIRSDLPGSFVLKNDSGYLQGVPDLLVLYLDRWGMLEVKPDEDAPYEPNQEYYLEMLDRMYFAKMICPQNEEEVLRELYAALTSCE